MKQFLIMCVVLTVSAMGFAEMFGGSLAFKDGGTVEFIRLGDDHPAEYSLYGKLGGQQVSYKFSDLGQIIFSGGNFDSGTGEAILVSKDGKRFSLTGCRISGTSPKWRYTPSWIVYRYLDPVTNQEQNGKEPAEKIVSLMVGSAQGSAKKNPVTGEFFPSIYSFDPFTGQKLEWANP